MSAAPGHDGRSRCRRKGHCLATTDPANGFGRLAGVRRTQALRGRPAKPVADALGIDGEQSGFGF